MPHGSLRADSYPIEHKEDKNIIMVYWFITTTTPTRLESFNFFFKYFNFTIQLMIAGLTVNVYLVPDFSVFFS